MLLHLVHARERARAHRTLEVARTVNVVVVAEVGDRLEAHQTLPLARLQFDEHAVDHVRTWHTAACCKNQTRRVSMTADSLSRLPASTTRGLQDAATSDQLPSQG